MNTAHDCSKTFFIQFISVLAFFLSMQANASIFTLEEFLQQLQGSKDKEIQIVFGRMHPEQPMDPFVQQKLKKILPVRSNVPVIFAQPNFILQNFGDHLKLKPESLTEFLMEGKGNAVGKQNYRLISLDDLEIASIGRKGEYVFSKTKLERPEVRSNFADELLAIEEFSPSKDLKNSFEDIAWLIRQLNGFNIKVTVLGGDTKTFEKLNALLASLEILGSKHFSKVEINFLMTSSVSAAGFYLLYHPNLEKRFEWIDFQVAFHSDQNFWPLFEFRRRSDYLGFKEFNFSILEMYSVHLNANFAKEFRKELTKNLKKQIMHTHVVDYSNPNSREMSKVDHFLYDEGIGIEITRYAQNVGISDLTWVVTVRDPLDLGVKFDLSVTIKNKYLTIPPIKLPCGTGYTYTFSAALKSVFNMEVKTRSGNFFFSKQDLLRSSEISLGQIDFLPKPPSQVFEDYEEKLIRYEIERVFNEDAWGRKFLDFLRSQRSKIIERILSPDSTASLIASSLSSCESTFSSEGVLSRFSSEEIAGIDRLRARVQTFANHVYTRSKDVKLTYDQNRK